MEGKRVVKERGGCTSDPNPKLLALTTNINVFRPEQEPMDSVLLGSCQCSGRFKTAQCLLFEHGANSLLYFLNQFNEGTPHFRWHWQEKIAVLPNYSAVASWQGA